ncbi:MAG TPA: hypothetical protein PLM07_20545, partial [Candidatus Rifleibacterium sp.]|nr:hypothetical protein [Candidatus Rifleibacterium sp.]
KTMNAVEYLCTEARWNNQKIFRNAGGEPALPTRNLSFGLTESYIVQDHVDQFLYAFAEAGVLKSQKILADDGTEFTVADMIKASTMNFVPTQELGWTLVVLPYYLGADASFTTKGGVTYNISDLIALACQRDITKETEAGTHHLYGVGYALKKHLDAGGKLDGAWATARTYLDTHIEKARNSQQSNGIFSIELFGGWKEASSPRLNVWGNGHMLEWLAFALSPEQLGQEWVKLAATSLTGEIMNQELSALSDGGMYHAVNGLKLYQSIVNP